MHIREKKTYLFGEASKIDRRPFHVSIRALKTVSVRSATYGKVNGDGPNQTSVSKVAKKMCRRTAPLKYGIQGFRFELRRLR